MQQQTTERPRTEQQRRTVQAREQREAQMRAAEQRSKRSAADGVASQGQYVAHARIVSGAPGAKERVVIERDTVFDPAVPETQVSEEDLKLLVEKGAVRPIESPPAESQQQPEPPPPADEPI